MALRVAMLANWCSQRLVKPVAPELVFGRAEFESQSHNNIEAMSARELLQRGSM